MRRSSRRSSVAVSLDSALDADVFRKPTTRRSSILPPPDDTRNPVGNFSTKFSMSSFVKKVAELTHDQRTAIERVGFGNLLHIHQHTLRKNLLVEWMERWDCKKRAFSLLGRELTIGPIEAALILGLRGAGCRVVLNEDAPFSDSEEEYGATSSSRKISVAAIERRLESLGHSADEDFIRTFLLFVFGTLLFHHSNGKIDSRYVLLLDDLDKVADFAWGEAVVEDLFNWLTRWKEEQGKNMEGCLILLQIWSYEHILIGRPNLLDCSINFPRACRWDSSRCNSQRIWFATKFNELEETEVTWKLQPTSAELEIDFIRELVEGETGKKQASSRQNFISSPSAAKDTTTAATTTTTSTQCTGLPPKSSRRVNLLPDKVKGEMRRGRHDIRDDNSESSRLSENISEITVEFPECSSSFNLQEVQDDQISDTSDCVEENYRVLKTEYSKLKEDNAKLRRENAMLQDQLSSNSKLEEEVARLRRAVDDLEVENQQMRWQAKYLNQLERDVLEYFEVQDVSHEKQLSVP